MYLERSVPMDGKYARLERGPGFLGEIGFLRACCTWTTDRESTFRATGDVFITPGSTYLYWESEQLRRAVAENEWLHRAIIALIALTLANKLTDDYRAPEPLPTPVPLSMSDLQLLAQVDSCCRQRARSCHQRSYHLLNHVPKRTPPQRAST